MRESTLKVQAGSLKGIKIPFPVSVKGNSNFTSAIVKKSIFSMLDSLEMNSRLSKSESIFIDLFSGSAQIGIEAASQGFKKILFYEIDSNRYRDLKKFLVTMKFEYQAFHKDSFRFHSSFEKEGFDSLVYFIDPPFSFFETDSEKIIKLVNTIIEENQNSKLFILIQSPKNFSMEGFTERLLGNQKILINF